MGTSEKEPVPVSSLESNKLSLETAGFALTAIIREATGDVNALALEHSATVCCLLDPSLPDQIVGDSQRLRAILVDLLTSAIRSAAAGEVKLSVFPSGQSEFTLDLTFEVTVSAHAPLGEPDQSAPGGSLAPAKKLAQGLGGELGVHSQNGTTPVFWCRIPVQHSPSHRSVQTRDISVAGPTDGHAKSPCRILMAEDNSINQRVGKLILQRAGYLIDMVGDGSEAVEAHRGEPYDMILMDCQMPTMDGFEATRRIRTNSHRQPIIIAVTANALVGERERCLAAGMDDYLSKPFQAEQLVAIVKKWVDAASNR
jgi:two-component system, sensor histidine kinase and response regulator